MQVQAGPQPRSAFTLVELLVVIGIIGILIAILLPSVAAVRNTSRKVKTQGTFSAISQGLEAYRQATGDDYPPSGSDSEEAVDPQFRSLMIKSPYSNGTPLKNIAATGANMLVYALAGADLLGTAGFKDVNRRGGFWDDLHNVPEGPNVSTDGLYALDEDSREPLRRRYEMFIDINKAEIVTMGDYAPENLFPKEKPDESVPLPGVNYLSSDWRDYLQQPFILDGFGYPILYYKANSGASLMVPNHDENKPGVYDPAHNALYTGYIAGSTILYTMGMDLGAGRAHRLLDPTPPSPNPAVSKLNEWDDRSFARYIWDRNVQARNEAVNKNSYLLISAGRDALWGTEDDTSNFQVE